MSMIRMARGAARQLVPQLRVAASRLAAPGTVTNSAEGFLTPASHFSWSSAAPTPASAFARGFAAAAQAQATATPDGRVQPLADHVADAITARKASTDGVGGVPGSKKSTATGAEAEVLKESRLERGSPADDETLKEPPPARSQGTYWLMQPVHRKEYVEGIKPKHLAPTRLRERLAYRAINMVRWAFDKATGYGPNMTEKLWLRRIIYLETVAGVPGMVAGMLRHLHSLRRMKRDHGWIHTLIEEAENERMHLLTFLELRQPGYLFRAWVLVAQGVFFNFYFLTYLISPKFAHSLVGYLEEEAVKTYTRSIEDLDAGKLPEWENLAAPQIAKKYWKLGDEAGMRELLLAVRADEAGHSHVNHVLSKLKQDDDNPFARGSHEVP